MSNWAEATYVIDAIENQLGGGLDKDQYVLRMTFYAGTKISYNTHMSVGLTLPEGFVVKKFVMVSGIAYSWNGFVEICGVQVKTSTGSGIVIAAGTEYQVPPNTTDITAHRTAGTLGSYVVDFYIERQTIV